jgi:hypothetical protein
MVAEPGARNTDAEHVGFEVRVEAPGSVLTALRGELDVYGAQDLGTAVVRALPRSGQYTTCAARDAVVGGRGTLRRRRCGRRARFRCSWPDNVVLDVCERHLPAGL